MQILYLLLIDSKKGNYMHSILVFMLLLCACLLCADKISFPQQSQLSWYQKIRSFIPFLHQSAKVNSTLQQTQLHNSKTSDNFNAYLNTITAKRTKHQSKQDIVDQLKNTLAAPKNLPSLENTWALYTTNITSNTVTPLQTLTKEATLFAQQAAHKKVLVIDVPEKLISNYPSTESQRYAEIIHTSQQELDRICKTFLQNQTQENGFLFSNTKKLKTTFSQQLSEKNISNAFEVIDTFLTGIDALLAIAHKQNDQAIKTSIGKSIDKALHDLYTSANITEPKNINSFCFLKIKAVLYAYIYNKVKALSELYNVTDTINIPELHNQLTQIQQAVNNTLMLYQYFNQNTAEVYRKIFEIINKTPQAINISIAQDIQRISAPSLSTYITTQTDLLFKALQKKHEKLITHHKQFFAVTGQEISENDITQHLTLLDDYKSAYIAIKTIHHDLLVRDILSLTQFFLYQHAAIKNKITPLKEVTSQILYNYTITQSIAQYACKTIEEIIKYYRKNHNTQDNTQIAAIERYLKELNTYANYRLGIEHIQKNKDKK